MSASSDPFKAVCDAAHVLGGLEYHVERWRDGGDPAEVMGHVARLVDELAAVLIAKAAA